MTEDEIIRMLHEAGYPDYAKEADPRVITFAHLVAAAVQLRCIGIIYGQCGSDNVAQRTVDAIRKQS